MDYNRLQTAEYPKNVALVEHLLSKILLPEFFDTDGTLDIIKFTAKIFAE